MILALILAASAPAQTSPTPSTPKAKPPRERLVCVETAVTGSHLSGARECHTAAAWAEIHRDSQDEVEMDRNRMNGSGDTRPTDGTFPQPH